MLLSVLNGATSSSVLWFGVGSSLCASVRVNDKGVWTEGPTDTFPGSLLTLAVRDLAKILRASTKFCLRAPDATDKERIVWRDKCLGTRLNDVETTQEWKALLFSRRTP